MNIINLIGRLTRDPELKYSPQGVAVASFSVAVPRDHNREQTDFIDCVAFREKAETIAKYLSKGQQFGITGQLQIETFTRRDGSNGKAAKVLVNRFDFIGSKGTNQPAERPKGEWDSLGSEINVNGSTGNFEAPAPETDKLPW